MLDRLAWLGHASFFFKGPPSIYIDPFRFQGGPAADLVLITHAHYDHCSPTDVEKIATEETVIICPADCIPSLRSLPGKRKVLQAGSKISLQGVTVEAVPAYTRKSRMHGRQNGWIGYIVEQDGVRWYHAGDTDYIPEMRSIRADIACLPISGGTVMNPVEAAAAANCIGPSIAVPMHYGVLGGSTPDAELFRSLAQVKVRTLDRGPLVAVDPE